MRSLHALTIFLLAALASVHHVPSALAGQAGPPQTTQPAAGQASQGGQPAQSGGVQASSPDKLSEDVQRLTDRVLQIEVDQAKAPKSSGDSLYNAAIVAAAGLLGVLAAGLLTLADKAVIRATTLHSTCGIH